MNIIQHDPQTPNISSRHGADISMLVLHATVGGLKGSLAWLTNPKSKVSADYVIDRDGTIYQLSDGKFACWHAGASAWMGYDSTDIQRGSIGIELVNKNNGIDPYPKQQLDATIQLSKRIVEEHRIPRAMLIRHLDIGIPFGRKTDPAGFPYGWFMNMVYGDNQVRGDPFVVRFNKTRIREMALTSSHIMDEKKSGDIVLVVDVVAGERVETSLGKSNLWYKLDTGHFVWSLLVEPH